MTIFIILLILMTIAALFTVMTRSLLKATIWLAVTSAIISILIFTLGSPIAGVFELSVCTGLITAVFVSAISLTKPLTRSETAAVSKDRMKRFWYLPVIVVVAGIALVFSILKLPMDFKMQESASKLSDVREVLWNVRHLDLFGQIIIMLAGAFGVVILFRERKK